MKTITLIILVAIFFCTTQNLQAQNPTLSAGLETLTMNKGTIDVEVLTQLIMEKQKELKQEALRRFILKLFPETNYTTKFYVQNCLNLLLNEKNPQVIEKEIYELTTNYALALGVAKYYAKVHKNSNLINLYNEAYGAKKNDLPFGYWLDITSKALSETNVLVKKGFFRKKIDFTNRNSNSYIELSEIDKYKKFFNAMATMSKTISDGITPYIENYAVIEAFLNNTQTNKNIDIKETVIANTTKNLELLFNPDLLLSLPTEISSTYPALKTFINNFNSENTKITAINSLNNKLPSLPSLKYTFDNQKIIRDNSKNKWAAFEKEQLKNYLVDTDGKLTPKKTLQLDSAQKLSLENLNKTSIELKYNYDEAERKFLTDSTIYYRQLKDLNGYLKTLQITDTLTTTNITSIVNTDFSTITESTQKKINNLLTEFRKGKDAYKALLSKLALDLTNSGFLPNSIQLNENNKEFLKEYSNLISSTYVRAKKLIESDSITVEDVAYFDDKFIPEIIKLSTPLGLNKELNKQITEVGTIVKLLKLQTLTSIPDRFIYNDDLKILLKFVADLGKLDKAESYNHMLNLFEQMNNLVIENLDDQDFKKTYLLFSNAIIKYTLVDTKNETVEIDIASFLNDLQQYYGKNEKSRIGIYASLGLNQTHFFRSLNLPENPETVKNLGFASEKLGIKLRLHRFEMTSALKNVIKDDIYLDKRYPFINEVYLTLYGSGLLYSIANTTTNSKFDYPQAALSLGFRFYNALDFNLSGGIPFIPKQAPFKNFFIGLGLDIPLGEYLEKLGSKKK